MNFELIDNLFQVAVLIGSSAAAAAAAVRRRQRRLVILAFAYACFAMGTLFWLLHLSIRGDVPHVFYVSEISWIAAYLFCLSLQIVRTEGLGLRLMLLPALCAAPVISTVMLGRVMGSSLFTSGLLAVALAATVYLSVFRLRIGAPGRRTDVCLLLCAVLQMALYLSSRAMQDFLHFNLYFAIDLALTASFAALLPMALREEGEHDLY